MPRSDRISLFVFIDAFGWEVSNQWPLLPDVLQTRRPLETVLGYSSTCIPTILTGKMPREHGHFSFFRYDPENSPFGAVRWLRLLPRAIARSGRFRYQLSRWLRRWHGYSGYFQIYGMPFDKLPLFDYTEKRDLYLPGGINGGAQTVFDRFRAAGVRFHLSDWRKPEAANLASLKDDLREGRVSFAYLYLPAADGVMHAHGTHAPETGRKIDAYDRELRQILDTAHSVYEEVRLFAFSDHGMTNIREVCDLRGRIDSLGLRFGEDYAACYDSTMARFWFLKDGARDRIAAALRDEPRGEILGDDRLEEYGCDFPRRQYGELLYLMKPGALLCPSHMGDRTLAGMHGFAPEHKDSKAFFGASVAVSDPPKRLDGMHRTMLREEPALEEKAAP